MTPHSERELSEAIAGAKAPFRVSGGGTRPIGVFCAQQTLEMSDLRGVILYEPGALTLVAKAGTPLATIEEALASEGQRLAFEPMDHRALLGTSGESTIGGVVAANVSGPRRIQVGACRDFLLGVRFVDGTGRVLKNGGRVMKNVTGYDLVKLMAGSFGTLGVLSEVSLKVLPASEETAVLLIEGLDDARAVEALGKALGSPFEVTGAAHIPVGLDKAPVTMIRLEGFAESVSYRAKKLRDLLRGFGDIAIETRPRYTVAGWNWVRDVEPFSKRPGDVWRISVKPSDGPLVAGKLRAAADVALLYDWGGGLVWALVPEGFDVRAATRGIKGHARIERACDDVKNHLGVFAPQGPALERISRALRAKFDPRGILNPGLMG